MGVRVLFTGAREVHKPGTPPVGVLSLELLGSGTTAVTTAPQPARLVFSGRYFESARTPSGEFADFASLSGSIRLSSSGAPEFTSAGKPEFTGEVPEAGSKVQQAELLLNAGGTTMVLGGAEGLLVKLPVPPSGTQFLEVGVELEVAGTVEATKDLNDRLDVRAFRVIHVKLEDTDGRPVPGETFEVRGSRRQRVSGRLDDQGEARVQGLSGTHCQVIFPNLQPEVVALDTGDDDEGGGAAASSGEAPVAASPSPDSGGPAIAADPPT